MDKEYFTHTHTHTHTHTLASGPDGSAVRNLPANAGDAGDVGSVSGLEDSPGGRNGNPLQYSCLGNPMDGGAWRATVHVVSESPTRLSD